MANASDVPRSYKPITPSNTVRQTQLAGVVVDTAGVLIFKTSDMTATISLNVVVGQEIWGFIDIIGTSSTAVVFGIVL